MVRLLKPVLLDQEQTIIKVVFNLTREPIVTYNKEGDLIKLLPVENLLELSELADTSAALIVPDSFYENLTYRERMDKDYVHISRVASGRNGVQIVKLETFNHDEVGRSAQVVPAEAAMYRNADNMGITYKILKM